MTTTQTLDQARGLRELLGGHSNSRLLCFFATLPAMQKNALLINLAYAISQLNKSVHLIDANQSHHGISVKSRSTIAPLLLSLTSSPPTSHIACYDTGILISKLTDVAISQISNVPIKVSKLTKAFENVLEDSDLAFLDLQADDDSHFVIKTLSLSNILLLTTPSVDAIKSTYLQLKQLNDLQANCRFTLIIADGSQSQAEQAYANLRLTAQKFLNVEISLLGILPNDPYFLSAVQAGKPVIDIFPKSHSTLALVGMAKRLIDDVFATNNN